MFECKLIVRNVLLYAMPQANMDTSTHSITRPHIRHAIRAKYKHTLIIQSEVRVYSCHLASGRYSSSPHRVAPFSQDGYVALLQSTGHAHG